MTNPPPLRTRLAAWFLIAAAQAIAPAQEAKKEDPAGWLPILREQAADYRITPRDPAVPAPKPLAEPILRWTQPVRGGDDGAVFLWVSEGRPAAVVSTFTYRVANSDRTLQHEVHSFLPVGLDAPWRGRDMWKADEPGVTFQPVPDAPAPAATPATRLRQMQAIARDFSAENRNQKTGRNELRLMPRPMYRNEPAGNGPIDGALFCLAHGTDPEVFLLLEARKGEGAAPATWQYAPARFSDLPLRVRFKGREVWSVGPGQWDRHDGVHAYYIAELVDADTPEEYRKATKTGGSGR